MRDGEKIKDRRERKSKKKDRGRLDHLDSIERWVVVQQNVLASYVFNCPFEFLFSSFSLSSLLLPLPLLFSPGSSLAFFCLLFLSPLSFLSTSLNLSHIFSFPSLSPASPLSLLCPSSVSPLSFTLLGDCPLSFSSVSFLCLSLFSPFYVSLFTIFPVSPLSLPCLSSVSPLSVTLLCPFPLSLSSFSLVGLCPLVSFLCFVALSLSSLSLSPMSLTSLFSLSPPVSLLLSLFFLFSVAPLPLSGLSFCFYSCLSSCFSSGFSSCLSSRLSTCRTSCLAF